jgi:hypothetical protein
VQCNYVLLPFKVTNIEAWEEIQSAGNTRDSRNLRQEAPSNQPPSWFHLQRLNFRGPSLHILTARGAPGRVFTGQWRMDYASMGFWDQRRLPSPHTSNCFIIPATQHSPSWLQGKNTTVKTILENRKQHQHLLIEIHQLQPELPSYATKIKQAKSTAKAEWTAGRALSVCGREGEVFVYRDYQTLNL